MRIKTWAVCLLIMFSGTLVAWAQPGTDEGFEPPYVGDRPGHFALMEKLNLSPEQEKKFQELRLKHQKEMLPLQNDLRSVQLDIKTEMLADKPNQNKINDFIEKAGKARIEMEKKRFVHRQAMRDLLTDEQKKIWDKHKGQLWGKCPGECPGKCGGPIGRPGHRMRMQHQNRD